MKKFLIFSILFCALVIINAGCSPEFKDGASDIDNWEYEVPQFTFNHPCMLHTDEDFDYVIKKVKAEAQPWYMGYEKLLESPRARKTYQPSPKETIERPGSGYGITAWDGAAAYQLALMWRLTGDNEYAEASINVLNSWAKINKAMIGNERILSAGFCGYQYANAAEIMRDYSGWKAEDFEAVKQWLLTVVYPICYEWLGDHFGNPAENAWLSWDLPAMVSMLSIGILCEDTQKINFVLNYFYNGAGPGCIKNAVVDMHEDPAGNVKGRHLAQSQEMGRDQGHSTLDVPQLAYLCQMFYNIGIDLFSYNDNIVLDLCEYTAKYNVYPDEAIEMPYTPYYSGKEGWHNVISQNDPVRGRARPGWELIYNHYKLKGANPYYSREFARTMRPEGGGHRGSAESDDMGFGTLMYTREPIELGEDQAAFPVREY